MSYKMHKKGQIAIWIIIIVAIVASFAILFFLRRSPTAALPEETNPQLFVQKCIRDNVNDVLKTILPQGGFVDPPNYKLYNNTKITYLCENRGYYFPCVNQHPMLINEVRKEIENNIRIKVDTCYSIMKIQFEKRQYNVNLDNALNLGVTLKPGRIDVSVEKKVSLTKGDENINFDNFAVSVQSHTYELLNLAAEITSQEATYCNFEYVGYMILYPDFSIRRDMRTDGTKIYIIKDRRTDETFQFAIRGCVIPPGI